jgi:energy-coupling factor transport system permease protein
MTGSLDRAVDVAATLELRGYSLNRPDTTRPGPASAGMRFKSRYDARFYATGLAILIAAIAGKPLGADGFHAYPTIEVGLGFATVVLSALIVLSGLAPRVRHA